MRALEIIDEVDRGLSTIQRDEALVVEAGVTALVIATVAVVGGALAVAAVVTVRRRLRSKHRAGGSVAASYRRSPDEQFPPGRTGSAVQDRDGDGSDPPRTAAGQGAASTGDPDSRASSPDPRRGSGPSAVN